MSNNETLDPTLRLIILDALERGDAHCVARISTIVGALPIAQLINAESSAPPSDDWVVYRTRLMILQTTWAATLKMLSSQGRLSSTRPTGTTLPPIGDRSGDIDAI